MKERQDIADIETFFDTCCTVEHKPKTGTDNDRISSRAVATYHRSQEHRNIPSTRTLVEQITTAQALESIAIRKVVGDRWLELFRDLAPELDTAVDNRGRHVPCPMHGGRDGFRLFPDSNVTGGGVCNTCGFFPYGTRLLAAVKGWSIDETLLQVRNWLIDQALEEEVDA